MFKSILLTILTLAAVSAAPGPSRDATRSRDPVDDVEYYSCAGKPDGNYLHPYDCTRFITCHNGRAADMPCPDCDMNNVNGCQGNPFLVYDIAKDRCEWPKDTPCHSLPTTTKEPAQPKPTTESSTDIPGPDPERDCDSLQEGKDCNVVGDWWCDQCNWCKNMTSHYFYCAPHVPKNPFEPITGKLKLESCDPGYLIDPTKQLSDKVNGWQCTKWEDLDESVKDKYSEDKDCIPDRELCVWGQAEEDKCTGRYWYQERPWTQKVDETCPGDSIWDQETLNCRDCEKVESCKGNCRNN